MKKLISAICALSLCAALLAGCNGSSSGSDSSSQSTSSDTTSSSVSESLDSGSDVTAESGAAETETADTAKLESIVSALEAVNPVENPFALDGSDDDFYLENTMGLTKDNIIAYRGDVTNNQADCALVFVAQVKDGTADTVKSELEAFQSTMTSSLYAEFADKVAKAQDARIVTSGNLVVMVISGVNGPDYADIDAAIESALA